VNYDSDYPNLVIEDQRITHIGICGKGSGVSLHERSSCEDNQPQILSLEAL
jgi:hypothetical protein